MMLFKKNTMLIMICLISIVFNVLVGINVFADLNQWSLYIFNVHSLLVIMSWVIYRYVPNKHIGLSSLLLINVILQFRDFVECIYRIYSWLTKSVDTDINLYGIEYIVYLIIVITILANYKRWKFTRLKSDEYKDNVVYICGRAPRRFVEGLAALFGMNAIGSFKMILNGKEYKFTKKAKRLVRDDEKHKNLYIYKATDIDPLVFERFVNDKILEGKQYNYLTNNCRTVWKPLIKVKEYFK